MNDLLANLSALLNGAKCFHSSGMNDQAMICVDSMRDIIRKHQLAELKTQVSVLDELTQFCINAEENAGRD